MAVILMQWLNSNMWLFDVTSMDFLSTIPQYSTCPMYQASSMPLIYWIRAAVRQEVSANLIAVTYQI